MSLNLKRWLPPILWASLIFFLSSQPTLPSASTFAWDYLFKKTAHVFVYLVLYLLTVRAFKKITLKTLFISFIICVAYGISDEIHQSFVPGRTARITDVGFDTLGTTLGLIKTKYLHGKNNHQ